MSTPYKLPLTPGQNQNLSVSLAGVQYNLRFIWNNQLNGGWVMDIYDVSGNAIITGIPLVTGEDLLGQYSYLNLGGGMVIQTNTDPLATPDFEDLGVNTQLYYVVVS